MKFLSQVFVLILILSLSKLCLAAPVSSAVKERIQAVFGENVQIQIVPFKNQLLEISIGPKTLFASLDGQYIFAGPILDTKNRINIIELKDMQYRKQSLAKLEPDMYLSFPATTKERYTVTLFTDIDCTFCRRFHASMNEFNALGITVNYVMLPRSGSDSPSYHKAVSVFCSNNPAENMTLAMKDQFIEKNSCQHTISRQLELAQEFGIGSTPTMVLPDGGIKVGLMTPANLIDLLTKIK